MKRLSFILFIALSGSLLIQSCKQGDKSNTPVPKDAVVVMHINNTSLSTKLSWQEIKATNWFKELYSEAPDSLLRKLMDDPDNSGMDTKADMMMFMKKAGPGGYLAFEGTLKDAAAFEAFNKKVTEGTTTKDGDASYMAIKNQGVAYWKATRFVYIVNVPSMEGAMGGNDFASKPFRFSIDSLRQFAKATFEISGKNSLNSDDRFSALLKEDGDIHFWVNNEEYISALSGEALSVLKMADIFKGNVSASTVSFDNGKISMKSKAYLNDKMADLYKKYASKKISADVINRIPSQNVVGILAINYSPEGLKELVKFTGLDGLANGFLEKANYSIDEFVKANKGDLVIAVSDFEMKKKETIIPGFDGGEPYKHYSTQPDVKVLFATSVNDKAAFDKLIKTLSDQMGDQKDQMPKVTYEIDKNWFVAGNSAEDVYKFMAGGNAKHPFTSRLTDHSIGMYVDIQKILKGYGSALKDSSEEMAMNSSLKMWQDILVAGGGEIKNGAVNSFAEINLVDKSTNSLKQLNQYIDEMHAAFKSKRHSTVRVEDVILEETKDQPAPPPPPAKH